MLCTYIYKSYVFFFIIFQRNAQRRERPPHEQAQDREGRGQRQRLCRGEEGHGIRIRRHFQGGRKENGIRKKYNELKGLWRTVCLICRFELILGGK